MVTFPLVIKQAHEEKYVTVVSQERRMSELVVFCLVGLFLDGILLFQEIVLHVHS